MTQLYSTLQVTILNGMGVSGTIIDKVNHTIYSPNLKNLDTQNKLLHLS